LFGKPTRKKPSGCSARSARGLGVIRSVSDHDGLPGGNPELSKREPDQSWIRLAMFDVVPACHGIDEVIDIQ
jgi:hypothetical protein